MKHVKTTIAIAICTLMLFAQANASDTNSNFKDLPVELKYVGSVNDQPLLQLNFLGSKDENEFQVSITDGKGYTFYSAVIKGERVSKQFLLDTYNLEGATLKFEISSRKTGKTVVYQVSRHTKISEQMDLVKL